MKAVYGIGLILVVAVGSTITASRLYASGDRKVVSDADGGPWCSRSSCPDATGKTCCGGEIEIM